MQDMDDKFFERADAHIDLANEQVNSETSKGNVSASFMYGMARFSTFLCASSCDSKHDLITEKNDAIEYFVEQYRTMFVENYDNYIENFDKYMGKQEEK